MSDKNINPEEVRHMARLSRLLIDKEEEELFSRQFSQILGHMAVLEAVNTDNVEPLYSTRQVCGKKREDIANNVRTREQILANAPETDGETFIVPRIV